MSLSSFLFVADEAWRGIFSQEEEEEEGIVVGQEEEDNEGGAGVARSMGECERRGWKPTEWGFGAAVGRQGEAGKRIA